MKGIIAILCLCILVSAASAQENEITIDTLTVQGCVTYYDDMVELPVRGVAVKLLLVYSETAQREISTTVFTDNEGFYSFNGVSNVNSEDLYGREIKLVVSFENDVLKIVDSERNVYEIEASVVLKGPKGNVQINLALDEQHQHRGLGHIFNCVMDANDFLVGSLGWRRESIEIRWPVGEMSRYSAGSVFSGVDNDYINLTLARTWNRSTIFHEYGHAIMTTLYGRYYDLPKGKFNNVHYMWTVSNEGQAMREGWAEFCSALIDDDAFNVNGYCNTNVYNIESNTWWTACGDCVGSNTQGEIVEGAVASILWDIADTVDSCDNSPGIDDDGINGMLVELWDVMGKHKPQSILEFWDGWIDSDYGHVVELYAIFQSHGVDVAFPDVNLDGEVNILDIILCLRGKGDMAPDMFQNEAFQNYPNPFNPETWIPYNLAEGVDVDIRIYNSSGKLIRTLDLGYQSAGLHMDQDNAAYWDGRNEAGEYVASGVYFYNIFAGGFSATRKMTILK